MPSTPYDLVVIGGGGHGAVVSEAALALGHRLAGMLDDKTEPALCLPLGQGGYGVPRLGHTAELDPVIYRLLASAAGINNPAPPAAPLRPAWMLGIGEVTIRRRILDLIRTAHDHAATIVHPSAHVSTTARLGRGVFVGPHAVVHARAVVGDHAIINTGAIVEHDVTIADNTHIAPGTVLAGYVRVGRDTLVGLGSRVLPGMRIGSGAIVAAGAVVRQPVDDSQVVGGVPARPLKRRGG